MKFSGRHKSDTTKEVVRKLEIEEGEKVRIRVIRSGTPPKQEEPISYFMPGVLTLIWRQGDHL